MDQNLSTKFLLISPNKNSIERYSRYTSLGAVFAQRFNRTFRDILKRPVFEKGESNWIDILPIIKQYNIRMHSSTELTPQQTSEEKNEGCSSKFIREKMKIKTEVRN